MALQVVAIRKKSALTMFILVCLGDLDSLENLAWVSYQILV